MKKKFNANSLLALMDSSLTMSIRELHGLRYLQHDGDTSTRSLIVASEYALKLEKKAWLCMARQIFEITRMESGISIGMDKAIMWFIIIERAKKRG